MASDDWRIEFFSQLHENLADESVDPDDIRRSLEASGIDVTATITAGLKIIDDHKKRLRLIGAKRRLARLQETVRKLSAQKRKSLGLAWQDVARALAGEAGGPLYQAYHRKLESYTADDLASLQEDADLIEFLIEIEADGDIKGDT